MKPTMAVTLTTENKNSASPNPLMPHKLRATMAMRNIVMKTVLLMSWFQYRMVKAPAMISSGRTKSHFRA